MSGSHRPLPARPNLESERKHAKRLLRALHGGHAEALARCSVLPGAARDPTALQLADAQLIIAREYGFPSWPRLVDYYRTWERHEAAGPNRTRYPLAFYEGRVGDLLARHRRRIPGAAQQLGAYVPRFTHATESEILNAVVTEDDGRLAVARSERLPSWEALVAWADSYREFVHEEVQTSPFGRATRAIREGDIDTLQQIVDAHPEMLDRDYRGIEGSEATLIRSAWHQERTAPSVQAARVTAWLVERGVDAAYDATRALHHLRMPRKSIDEIEFLLGRGADPTWLPPDGIGLLDRALMVYWDPAPVDFIRTLVPASRALWTAAGLGDVTTMREFLGAPGTVTDAAREHRPDFLGAQMMLPMWPGASDREIIWEAFYIATMLQRGEAMDLLLSHGLPIDYTPYEQSLLHIAVGNRLVRVVELLMERGANPDIKGIRSSMTAREMAAERLAAIPDDPAARRVAEVVAWLREVRSEK